MKTDLEGVLRRKAIRCIADRHPWPYTPTPGSYAVIHTTGVATGNSVSRLNAGRVTFRIAST
jgi:hypothetical protein